MYVLEGMAAPLPIEIPLWLSGHLLNQGVAGYWDLVLATWGGTTLGNVLAFTIGRMGGRPLLLFLSSRLRMEEQVQRFQGWIERYGLGTVLVTRWINWGFGLSLWMVGFSEMPAGRSLAVMTMNNLLWSCAWVALGRVVVRALYHVGLPGWFMLVPGTIMLVGLGVWRLYQRRRVNQPRV